MISPSMRPGWCIGKLFQERSSYISNKEDKYQLIFAKVFSNASNLHISILISKWIHQYQLVIISLPNHGYPCGLGPWSITLKAPSFYLNPALQKQAPHLPIFLISKYSPSYHIPISPIAEKRNQEKPNKNAIPSKRILYPTTPSTSGYTQGLPIRTALVLHRAGGMGVPTKRRRRTKSRVAVVGAKYCLCTDRANNTYVHRRGLHAARRAGGSFAWTVVGYWCLCIPGAWNGAWAVSGDEGGVFAVC